MFTEQPGTVVKRSGIGLQHGAKSLLRNMIRHTDTHNRLLEEAEMWQIHYKMNREGLTFQNGTNSRSRDGRDGSRKDRHGRREEAGSGGLRETGIENSFLYDDRRAVHTDRHLRRGLMKRAHMDDNSNDSVFRKRVAEKDSSTAIRTEHGQGSSTYWQRQLLKAEEQDADRWGHGGFKELYPQEFNSDHSEDKETEKSKKKKKLREKRSGKLKKKRKNGNKGDKKHQKQKKRKMGRDSDTDTESGRQSESKRRKNGEAENETDNESEHEIRKGTNKKKLKEDQGCICPGHSGTSISKDIKAKKRKRRKTHSHESDSNSTDSAFREDCGSRRKNSKRGGNSSSPESQSESTSNSGDESDSVRGRGKRRSRMRRNIKIEGEKKDFQSDGARGESQHRKKKRRK